MDWSDRAPPELDGLAPLRAEDLQAARAAVIASGPVLMRLRSDDRVLWQDMARLYADYPGTVDAAEAMIADFTVQFSRVRRPPLLGTPRLAFRVNGGPVLSMQKAALGFALFEWGANWCLSTYAQAHLSVHAAVVERHGRALLLPTTFR